MHKETTEEKGRKKDFKLELEIEKENENENENEIRDGSKSSFFKLSLRLLVCVVRSFSIFISFMPCVCEFPPSSRPKTEVGQHLILCKYSLSSLTEPEKETGPRLAPENANTEIQKPWPKETQGKLNLSTEMGD